MHVAITCVFAAVISAFSLTGSGSFWSQRRDTKGRSDNGSNLKGLNTDDLRAGNSITGSIGGTRVGCEAPSSRRDGSLHALRWYWMRIMDSSRYELTSAHCRCSVDG